MFPRERHQMFCSVRWYKDYCPLNVCIPHLRLMHVSEVHADASHCLYFPFYQARERERERARQTESAGSEICVIWHKNITIVLTVNSQQEGSARRPPCPPPPRRHVLMSPRVLVHVLLRVLWPPPTVMHMHLEERWTGDSEWTSDVHVCVNSCLFLCRWMRGGVRTGPVTQLITVLTWKQARDKVIEDGWMDFNHNSLWRPQLSQTAAVSSWIARRRGVQQMSNEPHSITFTMRSMWCFIQRHRALRYAFSPPTA